MKTDTTLWGKLDNTAHLFPVIAKRKTPNVFRESITLHDEVEQPILQEAVVNTLKTFPGFSVRLKRGLFWYYLEENPKAFPTILEENEYPCRLIDYKDSHEYLFKVSYYKNRINLEIFHVLADGVGAKMFLKALIYHYLSLKYSDSATLPADEELTLEREDGFQLCYDKSSSNKSNYSKLKALTIRGRKLPNNGLSVIEGSLSVKEIKALAKEHNASINEFLVTCLAYSIYQIHYGEKKPIIVTVPVNLRKFFNSTTTKNFFAMVNATFVPENDDYCFNEVLEIIKESLHSQITKANFKKTISYNVSNEQAEIVKWVPLYLKNLGIKFTYSSAAKASTITMSNLGLFALKAPYHKHVKKFSGMLPMSLGQNVKATIASFDDELCITFTSSLRSSKIQREFFRLLSSMSLKIRITSNGENNVSL
jgi:NRPS condensation-like uncharacterized protein